MSETCPLPPALRAWICAVTLVLAPAGFAMAQTSQTSQTSQTPQTAQPAPTPPTTKPAPAAATGPAPTVPRLRSRPAVAPPAAAPGEAGAVRLMVFSLERQPVFEALTVVRPLLSVQGSVELDPSHNTISVRDNLAALSRVATAIRAFDRENQPVKIGVSLILAQVAKISPVRPDVGIEPDLLTRLRQLMRFNTFSLLAHGDITSREGEAVIYEMAQGYRLSFELGTVGSDGKRIRLADFRMVRALPGQSESELVRSVVNLGLDQPLILGLTRGEAADRALMLVLRFQNAAVPTATTAER